LEKINPPIKIELERFVDFEYPTGLCSRGK